MNNLTGMKVLLTLKNSMLQLASEGTVDTLLLMWIHGNPCCSVGKNSVCCLFMHGCGRKGLERIFPVVQENSFASGNLKGGFSGAVECPAS